MEYGMSFEPDWHQGSTATIVQGPKIEDKVAHNLAKVSQVASSAAAIYDSIAKAPKTDKTTAKKEVETATPESKKTAGPPTPIVDPNAVEAKPEVDNTTVEPGSELKKGFLTKAKESFNEFTDGDGKDKYGNYQRKFNEMFSRNDNPNSKFFKRINEENKNMNFIQRVDDYNKGNETPYIEDPNNPGQKQTHLMGTAGVNKSTLAFPTVVQKPGEDKLTNLPESGQDPVKYAIDNKEFIPFKSKRMARLYSENGLIDHNQKKATDSNDMENNVTKETGMFAERKKLKPGDGGFYKKLNYSTKRR
jgi:hypothetical protein